MRYRSYSISFLSTVLFSGTVPVQGEEIIPDDGLTKVDIIALALGLGLTTFLTVSIALLLYRAEMRRREMKYSNRWKISVKGYVRTNIKNRKIA